MKYIELIVLECAHFNSKCSKNLLAEALGSDGGSQHSPRLPS